MKYHSDYPIPAITTTAIIVYQDEVLLIKRKNDPFKDQWAFPGGFFNQFESARDCCMREVEEETGIILGNEVPDIPIAIWSDKERDPRGWVIDCPFLIQVYPKPICKANDDAKELQWFKMNDVDKMKLAFDHKKSWNIARDML